MIEVAPLLVSVAESELPVEEPVVPLPLVEEGTGRVEVTTAEVADTEAVAVPISTVKYVPAMGPWRPVDWT